MTDCTPTQARELSERLDDLDLTGGREGAHALRSLANQVEALTTENASILRASLYSADLATQAMEDVKTLTTERDALLQANLTHITEFGELQGWALSHPKSIAADHVPDAGETIAAPVVPGWTQVPIIDLQELYHSIHGNRFMGEEWEKKCISSMMPKEPK